MFDNAELEALKMLQEDAVSMQQLGSLLAEGWQAELTRPDRGDWKVTLTHGKTDVAKAIICRDTTLNAVIAKAASYKANSASLVNTIFAED